MGDSVASLRVRLFVCFVFAMVATCLVSPRVATAVEVPAGSFYISVYNVDDQAKILINGVQVTPLVGYRGDSGWIDITERIKSKGLDTQVRLWCYNKGGGYAWGYRIGRKLPGSSTISTVWTQEAGKAGTSGANNNDQSKPNRVVFDTTHRLGSMLALDGSLIAGNWYARALNVDDQAKILINGVQVTPLVGYRGDSGWMDITERIKATGLNTQIRCWCYNKGGVYAWGYRIGRKLPGASTISTVWTQEAGKAGTSGANNNDKSKPNRVVFDTTYGLASIYGNHPVFPVNLKAGRWYGLTYPNHEGKYGYQYSAVDLNMTGDADNGQPIYAVQDGVLSVSSDFVTLSHTKRPLYLKNGTRIATWYTMYGHLRRNTAIANGASVAKGTILGWVSNVSVDYKVTPHLHFVVYRSQTDRSAAISPYWLPGVYSTDKALYADDASSPPNRNNGGEPGLYENRIFSAPPSK